MSTFRRCTRCPQRTRWGSGDRRCPNCGVSSATWWFVTSAGKTADGKRRQVKRGGFETRKKAEEAEREVLGDVDRRRYVDRTRLTVAGYLSDWLSAAKGRVKPSTWEAMELHVRVYISPRIGDVVLQRLSRQQVKGLYAQLAEDGRQRGRGGLSAKTIWNVHLTLHLALVDAVADHLIPTNPADGAMKAPKTGTVTAWTAEGLRTFLSAVAGGRLFPLWRLAAMSGMRRGELLALDWPEIDLSAATVTVRDGKTDRARRTIDVDPETAAVLREWRRRQLEERLAAGPAWKEAGRVFARVDGSPLDEDVVSQQLKAGAARLGLPLPRGQAMHV